MVLAVDKVTRGNVVVGSNVPPGTSVPSMATFFAAGVVVVAGSRVGRMPGISAVVVGSGSIVGSGKPSAGESVGSKPPRLASVAGVDAGKLPASYVYVQMLFGPQGFGLQ